MIILFAAFGFSVGIVLAAYGGACWQLAAAAAAVGLGGLAWVGGRRRIPAIALACGVAAGAWRFSALADSAPRRSLVEYARMTKHSGLRGTVVAEPDCKSDRALVLRVRVEAVRSARDEWVAVDPVTVDAVLLAGRGTNRPPVGVSVPELASPAAYGYGVELNRVRFSVAPTGQPPARRSAGPPAVLLHWSGARVLERSPGWLPLEAALALKGRLLASFSRNLDDVPARLAAGMALGDKAAVYAASWRGVPLRDLFARAGTAHLLAVSGGNVTVLAAVVCWLCARFGLGRRVTLAPALGTVLVYTLMTGMPASAVRAGIMNAVGLALWALRPMSVRSGLSAGFGVSALFILGLSPEELFRPGFQLSFLAVAVLVLGSVRVDAALGWLKGGTLCAVGLWAVALFAAAAADFRWLSSLQGRCCAVGGFLVAGVLGRNWDRLPVGRRVAWKRCPAGVRMFLAAQIAVFLGLNLPLSGYYFGTFSVAGLAVNFLAIPIAAFMTPGALAVGLLGMVPAVDHLLAGPFAWLLSALARALLEASYVGAAWLGCPVVERPSLVALACYLAVLGIFRRSDCFP